MTAPAPINARTITIIGRTVVAENGRGDLFRRHRGRWRRLVMMDYQHDDQRRPKRYTGHAQMQGRGQ